MAGSSTIFVLHLEGIFVDQGVHESVVSLLGESLWDLSLIGGGILGGTAVELGDEVLEFAWDVVTELHLGPVVVDMAGEGAVGVGVLGHWAADVWLWVLSKLKLGPIVVNVAAESGIRMGVLWHWASDVWLWIFLGIGLNLGPIVVDMAAESAVRMGILWHWTSDVWLRVLTKL